jgi:predicted HicB family RNase H-like nuclease
MKKKSTGLDKFVEPEMSETEAPTRKRGKGETVGITIRLNQQQWRAVNEEALAEGISMSQLFIRALSERRQAKRLPPL